MTNSVINLCVAGEEASAFFVEVIIVPGEHHFSTSVWEESSREGQWRRKWFTLGKSLNLPSHYQITPVLICGTDMQCHNNLYIWNRNVYLSHLEMTSLMISHIHHLRHILNFLGAVPGHAASIDYFGFLYHFALNPTAKERLRSEN